MEDHREEHQDENERRGHRSKGVMYAIIAIVIIGAIAAAVWWAVATLTGPEEADVLGAVEGYFLAGAQNDREAANAYVYNGPDAADLGADEFSGDFDPETFFGFRGVVANHYFASDGSAYLYGFVEYNERAPREITAVLREREDGTWGLLRLALSEPMPGALPAATPTPTATPAV